MALGGALSVAIRFGYGSYFAGKIKVGLPDSLRSSECGTGSTQPLSTAEEPLGSKSSDSVEKNENTAVGIRHDDHMAPLYPQKFTRTSSTSGGRSVGIVRSRTQATEFLCVPWFQHCFTPLPPFKHGNRSSISRPEAVMRFALLSSAPHDVITGFSALCWKRRKKRMAIQT
jgi:hypothetical protein